MGEGGVLRRMQCTPIISKGWFICTSVWACSSSSLWLSRSSISFVAPDESADSDSPRGADQAGLPEETRPPLGCEFRYLRRWDRHCDPSGTRTHFKLRRHISARSL